MTSLRAFAIALDLFERAKGTGDEFIAYVIMRAVAERYRFGAA